MDNVEGIPYNDHDAVVIALEYLFHAHSALDDSLCSMESPKLTKSLSLVLHDETSRPTEANLPEHEEINTVSIKKLRNKLVRFEVGLVVSLP